MRPRFETSEEISGTILGVGARIIATYTTGVLADGSLYGETVGPCPTITTDGDVGSYIGSGAGKFTGKGSAVSIRGTIYYQGAQGKLAALNGNTLVFEWDVDDDEGAKFELWDWK